MLQTSIAISAIYHNQCLFCLQTSREVVILTEGNSENAETLTKLGLPQSGKKKTGKNNFSKSVKSQGILVSFIKTSCKRIDFQAIQVTRGGTVVFVSGFSSFKAISMSVKIVQRSMKRQGTLKFLMTGNPVNCL